MFYIYLQGLNSKLKSLIWVGACALCWAIWLSCNNDNARVYTPFTGHLQRNTLDNVMDCVAEGGYTSSKVGLSCV
jgi:hypothetical protein